MNGTDPIISIPPGGLLWLLLPVAAILAVSLWLRLGQTRRVTLAVVRAVVQLWAVGLVIGWVFHADAWYWIVGLLAAMSLVAGFTGARQAGQSTRRTGGLLSLVLGGVTAVGLVYLAEAVIGLHRWDGRYLVPLGGMLLGNAMTAATLSMERVAGELSSRAEEVETCLALGASPWQAVQPALRPAVNAALLPTINAMLIAGVVKLPGMMTGQMLGGSPPLDAAMYQLAIMIGILFCDTLVAAAIGTLFYRRYFTSAWQLRRAALADGR